VNALAETDASVVALLHDVNEALVVGPKLDMRILLKEASQHGLQDQCGGDPCRIQAQCAGRAPLEDVQRLARFDDLVKRWTDPHEVGFASFCKAHASRRPVQQPYAQTSFQLSNGLTEG